ncbi:hypothetical protein ACFSQT_37635 [Mesorhizobium calcicola]|uniref:Vitamin uptake-like sensor domain-containing protein n=1 Tax=Mesorhizobium calcicola TaxID=1300310 RepID=A0ABW4WSM4_9HYPH
MGLGVFVCALGVMHFLETTSPRVFYGALCRSAWSHRARRCGFRASW